MKRWRIKLVNGESVEVFGTLDLQDAATLVIRGESGVIAMFRWDTAAAYVIEVPDGNQ
jgi:hypothetical protein